MFPQYLISKSFLNTRLRIELIDKRVILGHGNVSVGTRHMKTLCCAISYLRINGSGFDSSCSHLIHCAVSASKLLPVNASLTLKSTDLLSILGNIFIISKLTKSQFSGNIDLFISSIIQAYYWCLFFN